MAGFKSKMKTGNETLRSVPPLPHHSWALIKSNVSTPRLSEAEAKQVLARFWEAVDA